MDPADEERARRTTFWLRLAIVPLLAVLAAILLLGRDEAAGEAVKTKLGVTAQGRPFKLGLDADGRPASFRTIVAARCPSGRTVEMPWDSDDGDGVRFRLDDGRLRVAERDELWELELDGRLDERGGLRGTMTVVVRVRPKTKPAFDCTARGVKFHAG